MYFIRNLRPGKGSILVLMLFADKGKLLLVIAGGFSCQFSELLVEVGKGIKAAFKTSLGYRHFFSGKDLTGITYPYLTHKFRERFVGAVLKITAEGRLRHIDNIGYFRQPDIFPEMLEYIFIDFLHSLGLRDFMGIGVIDAGNVIKVFAGRQEVKQPEKSEYFVKTLYTGKCFEFADNMLTGVGMVLNPAHAFFKQCFQSKHFPFPEKALSKKVFGKINDDSLRHEAGVGFKIGFVASPEVRKIRTKKNGIPCLKMLYAVTYQPGTYSFKDRKDLVMRMEVPVGVKVGFSEFNHGERRRRAFHIFFNDYSHDSFNKASGNLYFRISADG